MYIYRNLVNTEIDECIRSVASPKSIHLPTRHRGPPSWTRHHATLINIVVSSIRLGTCLSKPDISVRFSLHLSRWRHVPSSTVHHPSLPPTNRMIALPSTSPLYSNMKIPTQIHNNRHPGHGIDRQPIHPLP